MSRGVIDQAPRSHVQGSWIPLSIRVKEVRAADIEVQSFVFWPHELFSCMFHRYKEHFFSFIMPGKDRIDSFWKSQQGHDCISELLLLRLSVLMFFPSFFCSLHFMLSVISYALGALSRPCIFFCSYHFRGGVHLKRH